MTRLEVVKFPRSIIPEDEEFAAHCTQTIQDAIPLEVTEFPGPIAITTVEHPESPNLGTTVGIFVPDELNAWAVMSRFQGTTNGIIKLAPTQEGELTLDGTSIPVGAHVTLEELCRIFVHYVNDEGEWQ